MQHVINGEMSPNNQLSSLSVGIALYAVAAEEEPQQKHVYYEEDFSQTEQIADKLKTQIHSCEGIIARVSVMYVNRSCLYTAVKHGQTSGKMLHPPECFR